MSKRPPVISVGNRADYPRSAWGSRDLELAAKAELSSRLGRRPGQLAGAEPEHLLTPGFRLYDKPVTDRDVRQALRKLGLR